MQTTDVYKGTGLHLRHKQHTANSVNKPHSVNKTGKKKIEGYNNLSRLGRMLPELPKLMSEILSPRRAISLDSTDHYSCNSYGGIHDPSFLPW